MREFRVYGPPGTGKTTYLVERLRDAVSRVGGGHVRVVAFSRAAALEMGARALGGANLEIPRGNIGTLHAAMWSHLGRPPLAETRRVADDWNRSMARDQSEVVGGDQAAPSEDVELDLRVDLLPESSGDPKKLEAASLLRARLCPVEDWPEDVRDFYERWTAWKESQGVLDFTDLIERGLELEHAPGRPLILFVDEAQDLSALELRVVRRWGESAQTFVLAGDDDQTIYTWRGASADALASPLPREQMRILGKSYRLPAPILDASVRYVSRLSRRVDKQFAPSGHDGEVRSENASWSEPEAVAEIVSRYSSSGSVMFLASCGFMLDKTILELRKNGVPFHNPFRKTNGRWNPLSRVADRIRCYAAPIIHSRPWTWRELDYWLDACTVERVGLVRGARTAIERNAKIEELRDRPAFESWTSEDHPFKAERAPLPTPDHLRRSLKLAQETILDYAIGLWETSGLDAVLETPRVVVGTIHSVKGAEADSVILAPDLSRRAIHEGRDADDVIRTFYVGMTRARRTLVALQPSDPALSADFLDA